MDRTIHGGTNLKISLENIADRKRIAVRLNNKEEARALLDEMWISYPNHVDGWDGPSWSRKYAEDGGGMCYCLRLGSPSGRMTFCSYSYFVSHGVEVIEFEDLIVDGNADICEADSPIESLFS